MPLKVQLNFVFIVICVMIASSNSCISFSIGFGGNGVEYGTSLNNIFKGQNSFGNDRSKYDWLAKPHKEPYKISNSYELNENWLDKFSKKTNKYSNYIGLLKIKDLSDKPNIDHIENPSSNEILNNNKFIESPHIYPYRSFLNVPYSNKFLINKDRFDNPYHYSVDFLKKIEVPINPKRNKDPIKIWNSIELLKSKDSGVKPNKDHIENPSSNEILNNNKFIESPHIYPYRSFLNIPNSNEILTDKDIFGKIYKPDLPSSIKLLKCEDFKKKLNYDINKLQNSIIKDEKTLDIVSRNKWEAKTSNGLTNFKKKPALVLLHHTSIPDSCISNGCKKELLSIQDDHMNNRKWPDIGYNFLIGKDGVVYEGRGWDKIGAHVKGYNSNSLGIAMIADHNVEIPNEKMVIALFKLIASGVKNNKISENYIVQSHSITGETECPGKAFKCLIKLFPHYQDIIK